MSPRVYAAIGILLWSVWMIMLFGSARRAPRVTRWLAIAGAVLIIAVMLAVGMNWMMLEPKQ